MRKRFKRELGTLAGVLVILAGLVFANSELRRSGRKEVFIAARQKVEKEREKGGQRLMKWSLLRKTKGTYRSGPTFDKDLLAQRDQFINLVGFMVPLEQFREMTEFLLLPMPLQCYFCESPPMRDVVLVQMMEGMTADLVEEPLMISGTLKLKEGPKTPFFYVIESASTEGARFGRRFTRKTVPREHMMHQMQQDMPEKQEMLSGEEPPTAKEYQQTP